MSSKFYPLPFSVTLWCADIALQSVKLPKKKKKGPEGRNSVSVSVNDDVAADDDNDMDDGDSCDEIVACLHADYDESEEDPILGPRN